VKIYTRTGDRGLTALLGGRRVPKSHLRVTAYGEVDELNAALGTVGAQAVDPELRALLAEIQRRLFAVGAQLADPRARIAHDRQKAAVGPADVELLERAIDEREAALPPLRRFILPGGAALGAQLHLARTVCRRAERVVVALSAKAKVDARLLAYLNRLSDLLFVLARFENQRADQAEEPW
jgi:cob(I)alamin adenosyltransferase